MPLTHEFSSRLVRAVPALTLPTNGIGPRGHPTTRNSPKRFAARDGGRDPTELQLTVQPANTARPVQAPVAFVSRGVRVTTRYDTSVVPRRGAYFAKLCRYGFQNDVLKPANRRPVSEETLSHVSTGGWPMYSFLVVMLWISS